MHQLFKHFSLHRGSSRQPQNSPTSRTDPALDVMNRLAKWSKSERGPSWSAEELEPESFVQQLATPNRQPGLKKVIARGLNRRYGRGCVPEDVEFGERLLGSYNAALIVAVKGKKWVLRLPFRTSFNSHTFTGDVATLIRIKRLTSLPVPEVLAWAYDDQNPIGTPYMLTSFLEGTCLIDVWFEEGFSDDKRHLVLRNLAIELTQLDVDAFKFTKIGDLLINERNELEVGPIYAPLAPEVPGNLPEEWPEEDREFVLGPVGPFLCTRDWNDHLLGCIKRQTPEEVWLFLLRMLVPALSESRFDGPKFGLAHADLDLQNILINVDTCEIMGILDWDHVSRTRSRAMGCTTFPLWIRRDWNPYFYGYDGITQDANHAPTTHDTAEQELDIESVTDVEESSTSTGGEGSGSREFLGQADKVHGRPGAGNSQLDISVSAPTAEATAQASEAEAENVSQGSDAASEAPTIREPPEKLEAYRATWLDALRTANKPELVEATRYSHIIAALDAAMRSPVPRGGIGFKLASYVFGTVWLNPFDIPLALKGGQWYIDATRDA